MLVLNRYEPEKRPDLFCGSQDAVLWVEPLQICASWCISRSSWCARGACYFVLVVTGESAEMEMEMKEVLYLGGLL
jgi:hypothetical protein